MANYSDGSAVSPGDVVRGPGHNTGRELVGMVVGFAQDPGGLRVAFADAHRLADDTPPSAITAPAEWHGTGQETEPVVKIYGCLDYMDVTAATCLIHAADPLGLYPPVFQEPIAPPPPPPSEA